MGSFNKKASKSGGEMIIVLALRFLWGSKIHQIEKRKKKKTTISMGELKVFGKYKKFDQC